MNNVQQDFEDYLGFYDFSKYEDGSYIDVYVQHLWTGWRMAYDKYCQVVVELPPRQKYEEAGCYYDEMNSNEVIAALKKAGYKYKLSEEVV